MILAGMPLMRTVVGDLDGTTNPDPFALSGSPLDPVLCLLQLSAAAVINSADVDLAALLIADDWSTGSIVYLLIGASAFISGAPGLGGRSGYDIHTNFVDQGGGGGGGQGDTSGGADGGGGPIVTGLTNGSGTAATAGGDGNTGAAGTGGVGDNFTVQNYGVAGATFPTRSINGGQGGCALEIERDVLMSNGGTIRSGGGGGGGGQSQDYAWSGISGQGGNGGAWGAVGSAGSAATGPTATGEGPGSGGAAGISIKKNGNTLTKLVAGTITGPEEA